ncbi:MAG: hypothetical protein ABIQ40_07670 [Bacteroidia bacterium]
MNIHNAKTQENKSRVQENKSRAVAHNLSGKQGSSQTNSGFLDNRSETIVQRKLQSMINGGVMQLMKDEKLKEAVDFLEKKLGKEGITYRIIGSAAARMNGAEIEPDDIDVMVDSVEMYKKVLKLFDKEASEQKGKVESALEVVYNGTKIEFLSRELGGGEDKNDVNPLGKEKQIGPLDVLRRASQRQKGIRGKEIQIIFGMLKPVLSGKLKEEEMVLVIQYVKSGVAEYILKSNDEHAISLAVEIAKSDDLKGIFDLMGNLADIAKREESQKSEEKKDKVVLLSDDQADYIGEFSANAEKSKAQDLIDRIKKVMSDIGMEITAQSIKKLINDHGDVRDLLELVEDDLDAAVKLL